MSSGDKSTEASPREPTRARAAAVELQSLAEVVATLRAPGGCAWDRAQTHASLAHFVVDESHEVVDAIDGGDASALREELGDLLLLVVMHAQIATEAGQFALQDVVDAARAKMLRRHPHIFGDASEAPSWEELKRAEGRRSVLDGVARSQPALRRAERLGRRAAAVGFDWPDTGGVLDKIAEETEELREVLAAAAAPELVAGELGDLLFALANLARKLDLDPEAALHGTNAKFERRFGDIEATLAARGQRPEDATLEELDALWDEAKRRERAAAHDTSASGDDDGGGDAAS